MVAFPDPEIFDNFTWDEIKPYYDELLACELTPENIEDWICDWMGLNHLVWARFGRFLFAAKDPSNETAKAELDAYHDAICTPALHASGELGKKFHVSKIRPKEMEVQQYDLDANGVLIPRTAYDFSYLDCTNKRNLPR